MTRLSSGEASLLVRYTRDETGKTVKQAEIYTADEHSVKLGEIDPDAIKIVRRLQASGHHAYIVGGAVRDLLIGKHPKDFDIATDELVNDLDIKRANRTGSEGSFAIPGPSANGSDWCTSSSRTK